MSNNAITIFENKLKENAVGFQILPDGRYEIQTETGSVSVSIDNIIRKFNRDGDESAINRFINSLLDVDGLPLTWAEVQSSLFPMLEGNDLELSFGTVSKRVSEKTKLLLTSLSRDHGTIRFLQDVDLARWAISQQRAWATAESNLDLKMQETKVSFLDAGDLRLAVIEAEEPLKASLIRAPALKNQVSAEFGWPIIAVAPCRGFVFLMSKRNLDDVGRLGSTVIKEFSLSDYPISTEIWEIDDNGIRPLGFFPITEQTD